MLRKVKFATIGIAVVLCGLVTLQNTGDVTLRLIAWHWEVSMLLLLPATLLVGFALGVLAGSLLWRRASARSQQ